MSSSGAPSTTASAIALLVFAATAAAAAAPPHSGDAPSSQNDGGLAAPPPSVSDDVVPYFLQQQQIAHAAVGGAHDGNVGAMANEACANGVGAAEDCPLALNTTEFEVDGTIGTRPPSPTGSEMGDGGLTSPGDDGFATVMSPHPTQSDDDEGSSAVGAGVGSGSRSGGDGGESGPASSASLAEGSDSTADTATTGVVETEGGGGGHSGGDGDGSSAHPSISSADTAETEKEEGTTAEEETWDSITSSNNEAANETDHSPSNQTRYNVTTTDAETFPSLPPTAEETDGTVEETEAEATTDATTTTTADETSPTTTQRATPFVPPTNIVSPPTMPPIEPLTSTTTAPTTATTSTPKPTTTTAMPTTSTAKPTTTTTVTTSTTAATTTTASTTTARATTTTATTTTTKPTTTTTKAPTTTTNPPTTTAAASFDPNAPVISTTAGLVKGARDRFSYYFKGIPFAEAPIGPLRFRDPVPKAAWGGVLSASQYSAGCLQQCNLPRPDFTCPKTQSEDCLFLNVFTPSLPGDGGATSSQKKLLPVMAYIHGGSFMEGAAGTPIYESTQLAQREGMVVVTFNYRLGPFGSLFNGRDTHGNYNIKDQRLALRWVRDNIARFGGDASRLTLAGQSAGAMSVGCHMTSPLSSGGRRAAGNGATGHTPLFHAASMSSNPFGILMSTPSSALSLHNQLSDALRCPRTGNLDCLQRIDGRTLLQASLQFKSIPLPGSVFASSLTWLPTVTGDDELPLQPLFAADQRQGAAAPIPPHLSLMIGTVAQDGLYFVYDAMGETGLFYFLAKLTLDYIFTNSVANVLQSYYGTYSNPNDMHAWFGRILTDYLFYCPSRYFARSVAANQQRAREQSQAAGKVFGWYLSQTPSFGNFIFASSVARRGCGSAVCHSIDLPYMFRANVYAPPTAGQALPALTSGEEAMADLLQDAYGAFVRSNGATATPSESYALSTAVAPFLPQRLEGGGRSAFAGAAALGSEERSGQQAAAASVDGEQSSASLEVPPALRARAMDALRVIRDAIRNRSIQFPPNADDGDNNSNGPQQQQSRSGFGAAADAPAWPPMFSNGAGNVQMNMRGNSPGRMHGFKDDICGYFDSIGYGSR